MKNSRKFMHILYAFFKRRILFLLCLVTLWEVIFRLEVFSPLLFPSVIDILHSLVNGIRHQSLLTRAFTSLTLIFYGILMGLGISLILMGLSRKNKVLNNIIKNLTIYLNPIPGMAIFPLGILWFGLGRNAILFAMLHSVVWGLLINLLAGLDSIPKIQRDVGKNMELSKLQMIINIDIPACMPYIIAGTKAALARAWRTAISAELVAGVVVNNEGLGWLMNRQRSMIDIPGLYSTLIIIMVVGIFLDGVVFGTIENLTVKKWGMMK